MSLAQRTFDALRGLTISPWLGKSSRCKTRKNRLQNRLPLRGFEPLEDRSLLSITLLSEGFEGIFPTDNGWSVGDANGSGTVAYWDDVNSDFGGEGTHSGNWKGYCAGIGYAGTTSSPTYQDYMAAYMSKSIDLSGMSSATLSFWDIIPSIESSWDYARVYIDTTLLYQTDAAQTSWTQHSFSLDSYVGGSHTLKFEFDSDASNTFEGWYLDDILVTAEPITYDLYGLDCYAPDTIDWGQSFTLQIQVGNGGNTAVTTDFRQGIHLSSDTVWGNADDYDLGSYLHTDDVPAGGLGPDINLTRSLPSSAPSGYAGTGPFYVLMYTDLGNVVTETNETNNIPPAMGQTWDYDSFTIPLTSDLYGYSCYTPNALHWGEKFDVQGRVGNMGYADVTTDFWQSFYLSNDLIWGDADDIYLGQYYHSATVPATVQGPLFTQTLTLPGVIPADYSATGTFHIGMYTDAYNAVAESNETNNQPSDFGLNWDYDSFTISASQWTVLLYMNGDNNLSLAAYNEIRGELETVPYGDGLVSAVLVDYDGSNGTPTNTYRGLIRHDSDTTTIGSPLVDIGELDMGNPNTLEQFIEWGTATYPASHYALVMYDHGGGYTGFGDGGEVLSMSEIRTAIYNAGVHFSLIGYAACLMGMTEVAYDVRQWSDVFMASENEAPLTGWPLDTVLSDLNANPAMSAVDLGQTVVTRSSVYGGDNTMSSIITSQLDPLATALDSFANTSLSTATESDWTALRAARDAAQAYDPPSWGEHFRDLREFVVSVSTGSANASIRAAAVNVRNALDAAVDANWHGPSIRGNGLSIELQALGAMIHGDYNSTNLSFVADTHWKQFLLGLTGAPDLTGYDCYVPAEITWGQTFNLQGQVRNLGMTTVTPSFSVEFYLSNDQVWGDADDIFLGWYNHQDDVPAGGYGLDFNVSLALPASLPAGYSLSGTFYIGTKTDAVNVIPETDETNNGPGDYGEGWDWDTFVVPPPDLTGYDCYVPAEITWGQTFNLQGQVRNLGITTVTPSFSVEFYLSNDQVWGDADDVFMGWYNHQADVPAGGFAPDFNVSLTLPASAPAGYTGLGPFYIGIKTDATNLIAESNETNNGPGYWWETYDWDSFVVARVWDGGGADNYWTTTANWAGDVAPLPGDDLVFPTGAARLESVNDFPTGTAFGSIIVSGSGYHFHLDDSSSTSIQVQASAQLEADKIITGTLTIGAGAKVTISSIAGGPLGTLSALNNLAPIAAGAIRPISEEIATQATVASADLASSSISTVVVAAEPVSISTILAAPVAAPINAVALSAATVEKPLKERHVLALPIAAYDAVFSISDQRHTFEKSIWSNDSSWLQDIVQTSTHEKDLLKDHSLRKALDFFLSGLETCEFKFTVLSTI